MRVVTLLILVLTVLVIIVNCKPLKEEHHLHRLEKRSIFGLSAFVLSVLNAILAVSLNTSINRQNDAHGGIIG